MKDRRVVSLISLGCPKNLVDSEGLVSKLLSSDFRVVTEPADAEIAIVNTCGFLQASRKESLETIREVCALKKKAACGPSSSPAAWSATTSRSS